MAYKGRYANWGCIDNLWRVYHLATPEQHEAGVDWYHNANTWAQGVADKYKLPLSTVAAMTASLSVNNKWAYNKRDVEYVINQVRSGNDDPWSMNCTTYKNAVYMAVEIYKYGEIKLVGPKVEQFYADIMAPASVDVDRVTVDIWAFRAWCFNSKLKVPTITDAIGKHVSQDYLVLADMAELRPREAQAVVWEVVRWAGRGRTCQLPVLEAQLRLW